MAIKNAEGFWIDPNGQPVPPKYVDPVDKMRDVVVERLLKKADKLSGMLADFKKECFEQFYQYKTKAHKHYGINVETEMGNKKLYDFSREKCLHIEIHKRLDFNDLLQDAKALIDECIKAWSKGSDDKLILVVNQAFKVDKKGKVDRDRILGLRELNIKDKTWKKAMELINDSLKVVGSTTYLRFSKKVNDKMTAIPLDIAGV